MLITHKHTYYGNFVCIYKFMNTNAVNRKCAIALN